MLKGIWNGIQPRAGRKSRVHAEATRQAIVKWNEQVSNSDTLAPIGQEMLKTFAALEEG